jgi:hypothetical protein
MAVNYYKGAVFAIFLAFVAAPGYPKTCPNRNCNHDNPEDSIYCEECSYPFPRLGTENGVAVFRFQGVEAQTEGFKTLFWGELSNEIDGTGVFRAHNLSDEECPDLKSAFRVGHCANQQLVLVGDVSVSRETVWISAQFFDIETGYMIAAGKSYCDEAADGKPLSEAVEELVKGLPYRWRYSRNSTFNLELPPGSKLEGGGRVEIFGSYSYPWKFYADSDADPRCWTYLTPVKPKLVIPGLKQYEGKYEVAISENGEGSIKILETGGVRFEGGNTPDICYYYPPPKVPVGPEVPPEVQKEIPVRTPARNRWFVYLGGAYARHSYEYAEGLKSREDAGSAEVRVGYHRPRDWPLEVAGGYAAHVPYRYKYEYGGIYEGRGSIKGAYVSSVILSAAWVPSVSVWGFDLLPRLGGEGEYFFRAGNGTYEQERGWEWYYNELWNGFLLGPKAGVGFNFGPAKQYELTVGVSYSWPLGGNYPEHFGPLLRIAPGIQYYF